MLSGYSNSELRGIVWGLLDGDGSKYYYYRRVRGKVESYYHVFLTSSSFIETVQFETIIDRLYKVAFVTRRVRDARFPLQTVVFGKELFDLFNEEFLDTIAESLPLPYLVGLVYAEGSVGLKWECHRDHCFLFVNNIIITTTVPSRRRIYERVSLALDKLNIKYRLSRRWVAERGKWRLDFKISDFTAIKKILEFLPLNYKIYRYLLGQGVISFGIWVLCSALDYGILPRLYAGCYEGDCYRYLDQDIIEWLENAGLEIPRELRVRRALDLYNVVGLGSYYDLLDFSCSFIERNYDNWSYIREYLIEYMPSRYVRTAERYINYVTSGIKVLPRRRPAR